MIKYLTTTEFKGYRTKNDRTKLADGFLVIGSQNVVSTDGDTITPRQGYSLDGQENDALTPIESAYDWGTHSGTEQNLRSYDDELEFRYVDTDGNITWNRLQNGFTGVAFQFAEYWDTNEAEDILLFVNGDGNTYAWSGATTTVASVTLNTITKEGATSWVEDRFISDGTDYDKKIIINGVTYTYTGGETTATLTGVTPNPTLVTINPGDLAVQAITTKANVPASGYLADLIAVLNNQVWYGWTKSRQVYKSAVNDFTDFNISSPRLVGEGAVLTLDGTPTGFVVQEESMYISAGKDQWYKSDFVLSSDLQNESLTVIRLKTTAQEAAKSQNLIGKIKNSVVYISNEPTLDTLGRIENVDTPQSVPLSDPIKPNFDSYDFTDGDIKYFKNNLYIAVPAESLVLIFNIQKGYWEPPQVLPIRRFAVIGGELYGHSNAIPETYKLFDGLNDRSTDDDGGNPINAIAKFSYQTFGSRVKLKSFDEFFTEGYIATSTNLTLTLNYDYEGYTSITEHAILGNNTNITFQSANNSNNLGSQPLGSQPLGTTQDEITDLAKFRKIHETLRTDFFEIQVQYSTNELSQQWQILAYGCNATLSKNKPISIKR